MVPFFGWRLLVKRKVTVTLAAQTSFAEGHWTGVTREAVSEDQTFVRKLNMQLAECM